MEVQTNKPSFSFKNHPFLKTIIIDAFLVLLLFLLRSKFTHDFYISLLKMVPYFIVASFLIPLEKVANLPKNKDKRHERFFKVIKWSLIIGIYAVKFFSPFDRLLLNSPPDEMDIDTARKIITENQALLKVVLDEMRLPTVKEAKEQASMEVTTLWRKIVDAHPDAPKSETMQNLFDLGNFVSIVRDGDVVTFYCGNYDEERYGDRYDSYNYYNTSTYFYYKPDDTLDLFNIFHYNVSSYTLDESSEDKWVYKDTYMSDNDGKMHTSIYAIHRILPNWFYVSHN